MRAEGSPHAGRRLFLASTNEHKARELRAALPGWQIELLRGDEAPAEEGETFYENALAKARHGRSLAPPGSWVVGEDSGLEVEGLAGRPGIRSARYAGLRSTDAENVAKLLADLVAVRGDGRRARFISELVCLPPAGAELRASGTLAGRIADEPRGSAGFGYDPVFIPDGEAQTVAELGDAWKARESHRARAARALREALVVGGEAV